MSSHLMSPGIRVPALATSFRQKKKVSDVDYGLWDGTTFNKEVWNNIFVADCNARVEIIYTYM